METRVLETEEIEGFRVSPQQARVWSLQGTNARTPYRSSCLLLIEGEFHAKILRNALERVVERHEILRTTFRQLPDSTLPAQVIAPARVSLDDSQSLVKLSGQEQKAQLEKLFFELANSEFNFEEGPLLRFSLITLSTRRHALLITASALCADSLSMDNVAREIGRTYAACLNRDGGADEPPQYADVSEIFYDLLECPEAEVTKKYWNQQSLAIALTVRLPSENRSAADLPFAPQSLQRPVEVAGYAQLEALAQRYGTSSSTLLLACWQTLLWRLTGHAKMTVGTLFDGRTYEGLEGAPGLFAKFLPIHCDFNEDSMLRALVARNDELISKCVEWQDYFAWNQMTGLTDIGKAQLFFPFCFEFRGGFKPFSVDGLHFSIGKLSSCIDRFNIKLACRAESERLQLEFHYDQNLFAQSNIEGLAEQFLTLLRSILDAPETALDKLNVLGDAERRQLIYTFNQTQMPYSQDELVHHLIERQAELTPSKTAIICGESRLSYKELNERANRLGHHLRGVGVGAEAVVGVLLERSVEMVVALLGVLKAGGAYVPLDAAYPQERISFMLQDAGAQVLVTQGRLDSELTTHGARVVRMDEDRDSIESERADRPPGEMMGQNLAYVIYTSGSTGRPKGVQITHRSLVNMLHSMQEQPGLNSADILLSVTTLSFDIAGMEMYLPLMAGACLQIASRETVTDGMRLADELARSGVTVMQATPATWRLLLAGGWQGDRRLKIICGGEALPADLAETLKPKCAAFWNLYGPTETTIWSTGARLRAHDEQITIGRPIANTQIYVLDHHLQPVPLGASGELYIGGDGLSRGYRGQPGLTAEKFIPSPFGDQPGARLYRTGDLARYLPDGRLEYLGRSDQQVKVRGFRIEPGEIESVLCQHSSVHEAAVIAREDVSGEKHLVAYVTQTPEETLSPDELFDFLRQRLPGYMVPSNIILLDALPLTQNGKIDRKALPARGGGASTGARVLIAPRTETEKTLAKIWSELLDGREVGLHDTFFELGGHSLLLAKLTARIHNIFGVSIQVQTLFQVPTLMALADHIEKVQNSDVSSVVEETIDLKQEVALDPDIYPRTALPETVVPPLNIMLTGATGFVGAFLLKELLDDSAANVYCLVRASSVEAGERKLHEKLKSLLLWDDSLRNRIKVVVGDLAQPLLGLSATQFQHLASLIEVIYHNGALVNFIYPYSALRPANVLGTQEILRLATQGRLKPVHYISTLGVFHSNNKTLLREEGEPIDESRLRGGYPQSKWVAEELIELARSRGCPASIYRLGRITGHSLTGVSNTEDILFRMIKSCTQLGSAPILNFSEDMTPVDYVSKSVVHLAKRRESLGRNFHLVGRERIQWTELVKWMRSFGYPIRQIPFDQWLDEVDASVENTHQNAMSPLLSLFTAEYSQAQKFNAQPVVRAVQHLRGKLSAILQSQTAQRFDCRNAEEGLRGTSINCPSLGDKLLSTYFEHFIESGLLLPPHARQSSP